MVSKADIRRFQKFQDIGCIACRMRGAYSVPEVHHLKSGNKRRGHQFTIPLCPAHHRGLFWDVHLYGPSLARDPRWFHEEFGSDDELLRKTNELL